MKGKLLFVAGLATGYVVGTRAGRSAYTTLTERLRAARESAPVRAAVGRVKELAQDKVPALAGAASSVASTTAGVASAASSAGDTAPESAEEAAEVFEEQLPEAGGAVDDAASSLPTDAGGADESSSSSQTATS
jgi:hypothetical protein